MVGIRQLQDVRAGHRWQWLGILLSWDHQGEAGSLYPPVFSSWTHTTYLGTLP